jgi:hypothetical protein
MPRIGILMNSTSEMHTEIAERERTQHLARSGRTTLCDEFALFEQQLEDLKQ